MRPHGDPRDFARRRGQFSSRPCQSESSPHPSFRVTIDACRPTAQENGKRKNPLFAASQNGHAEAARMLIAAGADVNEMLTNKNTGTPLLVAAHYGHNDVIRLLIDAGANLDQGTEVYTPVYQAAVRGHVDTVRLLVEAGANPNRGKRNKESPIVAADRRGHDDVFQALIDAGTDTTYFLVLGFHRKPPRPPTFFWSIRNHRLLSRQRRNFVAFVLLTGYRLRGTPLALPTELWHVILGQLRRWELGWPDPPSLPEATDPEPADSDK
eukprot:m.189008 g.189008  ORF g.189008 m.189008 type:complete len:267 (+) comp15095_c0_seq2:463-1263(+)